MNLCKNELNYSSLDRSVPKVLGIKELGLSIVVLIYVHVKLPFSSFRYSCCLSVMCFKHNM